jgi:DNA polymerase-4
VGRVTVRFETAATGPGPVRTFRADDPDLVTRPHGRSEVAEEAP